MNNKGFMMAEVVVVASIVLVTLVGFYTSYNKIISIYNQRVDYYDIATLYKLAKVRDENFYHLCYEYDGSDDCFEFVDGNLGDVEYLKNGDSLSSISASNQTFKDYLSYLSSSVKIFDSGTVSTSNDGVLIMENCYDSNNCKYAYLEVDFDDSMS